MGAGVEGAAEFAQFDQGSGYAGAQGLDQCGEVVSCGCTVGVAVGGDHALVDGPGRFDLDVLVGVEQVLELDPLVVCEQPRPDVERPPRGVERVASASAVAGQLLLDASAALVESITCEADHVEGIHHCDRVGQLFRSGGLESGEAIHRDRLDPVAPLRWAFGQSPP